MVGSRGGGIWLMSPCPRDEIPIQGLKPLGIPELSASELSSPEESESSLEASESLSSGMSSGMSSAMSSIGQRDKEGPRERRK